MNAVYSTRFRGYFKISKRVKVTPTSIFHNAMRKPPSDTQVLILFKLVCALMGTIFFAFSGQAQALTWNPAKNASGPSDGSGSWLASQVWWNGTGNVNGTWTGATSSGAIFGAGTPGDYTVTLSASV